MAKRRLLTLLSCVVFNNASSSDEVLPIKSGEYIFSYRDVEFSNSQGFSVKVSIHGNKIIVTNPKPHGSIPAGVIEEATLMWHSKSSQWILGRRDADREATEVGGCSGGPNVIDFKSRIIWSCEGGS